MPFHEPSPETDGQRQREGERERGGERERASERERESEREKERKRERGGHINKTIINYFVSYKFSGQKKTVSRLK